MNKRVYIETSVISYLGARPSLNVLAAARQQTTLYWWERHRPRFDLFTSELVLSEAGQGDPVAAEKRTEKLQSIPDLEITGEVIELAKKLVDGAALPIEAMDDAIHIAVAAFHGMDYLLTWNYRHLDNAEKKPSIRRICAIAGYQCPEICTPQELMGEEDYV
jgi:predicted nucleic acid-binding protein